MEATSLARAHLRRLQHLRAAPHSAPHTCQGTDGLSPQPRTKSLASTHLPATPEEIGWSRVSKEEWTGWSDGECGEAVHWWNS